ncbi:MAG: hypothetical protein ACRD3T_21385 [Terriglobia bacterium]
MSRKRLAVPILVLGLAAAAIFYYHGGGKTPPGQRPLLNLAQENFDSLPRAFNFAPNSVRVVLLLSPT